MAWTPIKLRNKAREISFIGEAEGAGGGSRPWLDPIRVSAFATQETVLDNSTVTDGTFTLSYGGDTTAPIAWDASAAEVKAALEALTSITGTVTVIAFGSVDYSIAFDDLAEAGAITADGSALTGDDAPYQLDVTVQPTVFPLVTLANGDLFEDLQWYTPTTFDVGGVLELSDDPDNFSYAAGAWRPTGALPPPIQLDSSSVLDDFGVQGDGTASSLVAWLTAQSVANSEPGTQYAPAPAVASVTLYGKTTPASPTTQGILWIRAKVARAT